MILLPPSNCSHQETTLLTSHHNGGVFDGHILHPFEHLDWTCNDLLSLFKCVKRCELPVAREKIDGRHLAFTFSREGEGIKILTKGGKLENALTVEQAIAREKPHLKDVFVEALGVLTTDKVLSELKAITDSLNVEELQVETSLVHPAMRNVLKYKSPAIVILNVKDHRQTLDIEVLNSLQAKIDNFDILVNPRVTFTPDLLDHDMIDDLCDKLLVYITSLGYSTDVSLGEFFTSMVEMQLMQLKLRREIRHAAAKRLVTKKKQYLAKGDCRPSEWEVFQSLESRRALIFSNAVYAIEQILHGVTYTALNAAKLPFCRQYAIDDMHHVKAFASFVNEKYRDDELIYPKEHQQEGVKLALKRISSQFFTPLPTEGIVFTHKGVTTKLTGVYTPINKLKSYFHYDDPPVRHIEVDVLDKFFQITV